jgi:hypothetical protein
LDLFIPFHRSAGNMQIEFAVMHKMMAPNSGMAEKQADVPLHEF